MAQTGRDVKCNNINASAWGHCLNGALILAKQMFVLLTDEDVDAVAIWVGEGAVVIVVAGLD